MNVLIACEFSGIVRDAFRSRGHSAISCDIIECEKGPEHHIQLDILSLLETCGRTMGDGWFPDLMIAHPPCTYLANSGVRWLYGGKGTVRDPERWELMCEAAEFFRKLLGAFIPRIAVENPIMHRHASIRRHDQIIHPYQYGHGETKSICLWLKNLPPLVPIYKTWGDYRKAKSLSEDSKPIPRVHYASPGPSRWKERSRTLTGIADAMAEQWGSL